MEIIANLALIASIWGGLCFLAVGIVCNGYKPQDD
jgi:hypothetical protein